VGFKDDFIKDIHDVVNTDFVTRNGHVVPTTDSVLMRQAVKVEATYLYADLAGSSDVAHIINPPVAATIIRSFLRAASSVIRFMEGEIRSYDGDRVMGIFMGPNRNAEAIIAALLINWAVKEVVTPALNQQWPTLPQHYKMGHAVGISGGEALIVKAGVWGNNDLISIGAAPNVAAKLSDSRGYYTTYITHDVFDGATDHTRLDKSGRMMWSQVQARQIGGSTYPVLASDHHWDL
jgi:adenylate cyclase